MKLKNTYALLFTIALGVVELKAQIYTNEVNIVEGDGKVGIGTSELTSKLNVLGQNAQFFSGTATNSLWIGRTSTQKFEFKVTDSHGYFDYIQDETGNFSHIMFLRNLSPSTSADNDIRLQTSGASRLVIKGNGNVGIGSESPGEKLEVSGNIKSSGNVIAESALYFAGNSKLVRLLTTGNSTTPTTSDIVIESNASHFWAQITISGQETNSHNHDFMWHGTLDWDTTNDQASLVAISAVNLSAVAVNEGGQIILRITNTLGSTHYPWVKGSAIIVK